MSRRFERLVLLSIAIASIATSALVFPVARPEAGYDSLGYLWFADTLQAFGVIPADRPDRLPGYPLLILIARALAAPVHADPLATLAVLQVLLLAGLAPLLAYGVGRRATGHRSVGLIAAVLVATDLELQSTAATIMTEAPATTLVLLALWLRLRDGAWRRAAWAFAAAVLMKPYLAPVALVWGALDALRLRRTSAIVASVWPTALAVGGWLGLVVIAGGHPLEDARRIRAFTDFITVYQAGLLRGTVDPFMVPMLDNASRDGRNAYQAAQVITNSLHPANPGSNWQILRDLADTVIRKRPSDYVATRLAIVPYAWSGWLRFRARLREPFDTWQRGYDALFFGSFPVLGVLLALALWNGLGWASAIPTLRAFVVPIIVLVLATVASLSTGTYEVGREVILLRPMGALLWACVLGHVLGVLSRPRRGRAASDPLRSAAPLRGAADRRTADR